MTRETHASRAAYEAGSPLFRKPVTVTLDAPTRRDLTARIEREILAQAVHGLAFTSISITPDGDGYRADVEFVEGEE